MNFRGHSILHLSTPKISISAALKNAQKCEEKDAFYAAVDDSLDSVIKG